MPTTNSPNMNLPVPTVGNEPGPNYANDINNALNIIDSHTHAVGNGIPITPAGLNISTDLSFVNNNATSLRSIRLASQSGALSAGTDLGCVYNNGGNLYYNDGSGNQIAMTSGGGIAGTPGSIANLTSPATASYTAGSKLFTWSSGTSGKAAAMDNGAVTIRQTDTASANGVTLASPNALGSSYSITLPTALPGAGTQYMTLNSSGVIAATTPDAVASAMDSTGYNTITNGRTRTVSATAPLGGVAISTSTGVFATTSNSFVQIATLSLVTSSRPVIVGLYPDGVNFDSFIQGGGGTAVSIRIVRDSVAICQFDFAGGVAVTDVFSPTSVQMLDSVAGGSHTYVVQGKVTGSNTLLVSNCVLTAYEL